MISQLVDITQEIKALLSDIKTPIRPGTPPLSDSDCGSGSDSDATDSQPDPSASKKMKISMQ